MKYSIDRANAYIIENRFKVNNKYRHRYHMMPPVGWMNDPNGLVYYQGEYHVFYQFFPYDSKWGPMHWGHFRSKDLIKTTDEAVALAPSEELEMGCFSGGAYVGEKLNLIYTRHFENDAHTIKIETTCLATSLDGIHFEKRKEPLFQNDSLPANISRMDFRDPTIVYKNGVYYVFHGGQDTTTNQGIVVVLKGKRLDSLQYAFTIGPFYELGVQAECPSVRTIQGKDVLLVSGCAVEEKGNSFKNPSSSVFIIGKIDYEGGTMRVDYIREIDKGDSFYAPQFFQNTEKNIMLGWFDVWNKPFVTHELGHGWAGAMNLPREITVEADGIHQHPISSIYFYLIKSDSFQNCGMLKLYVTEDFTFSIEGINGSLIFGKEEGRIFLDTTHSNSMNPTIRRTDFCYIDVALEVFFDVSGIEIFIRDGLEVISSRFYIDGPYTIQSDISYDFYAFKKEA